MKPTPDNLAKIRVLYRNLDTLALWGIPYDMRADVGQQPRDIERARERSNDGLFRHHPSTIPRPEYQDPHEGWIWLGQPGWWGPYDAGSPERLAIEAFLAGLPKGAIPEGPCEWTRLSEWGHCNKGWLCETCRPCSCRCIACKAQPMTDTRPVTDRRRSVNPDPHT